MANLVHSYIVPDLDDFLSRPRPATDRLLPWIGNSTWLIGILSNAECHSPVIPILYQAGNVSPLELGTAESSVPYHYCTCSPAMTYIR